MSESALKEIDLALTSFSALHFPVSVYITNRLPVMYYTLKRSATLRHDSTEGLWVMRQTNSLGTRPDVHSGGAMGDGGVGGGQPMLTGTMKDQDCPTPC